MLSIYRLAIGIIAGLGMLVFGGLALADNTVKCGDKVMQADDSCSSTRKGVTTERTYDEQRSYNRRVGVIMTAAGPVVTIVFGALLLNGVRKRRSSTAPPSHASRTA